MQAGGAAAELVVTTFFGGRRCAYRLADGLGVDADRFTSLVNSGLKSYRDGSYERADDQLAQAQKLWHDEPMKDAARRSFTVRRASHLEESRRNGTITQQKVAICLDRHREAAGSLYTLTVEHPGEMEGWMALTAALCRSSRVAEAQEVCYQAMRHFQSEGVTGRPLKPLQDLQVDILNGRLAMTGALGF
jgi:DNA-binding SARP family transcriptional activator